MVTTVIHTRVDEDLKMNAEEILKKIGLSSSEAIRMFYRQIELHQGIPFDLKVPNSLTKQTLNNSAQGKDVCQAKNTEDLFEQLGI